MRMIKFIGVSTSGSLIHEVFPRWMRTLGIEAGVVGVDIPHDAPPELFREALRTIRTERDCLGAVITSHKTAIFRDAGDEFMSLDALATSCREINSIRNAPDGLADVSGDDEEIDA